jgi:hypothetical protein
MPPATAAIAGLQEMLANADCCPSPPVAQPANIAAKLTLSTSRSETIFVFIVSPDFRLINF